MNRKLLTLAKRTVAARYSTTAQQGKYGIGGTSTITATLV